MTTGSNPFARKPAADANGSNNRNPFANKNLHKSESFFNKVDAAEADKARRGVAASTSKGKGKERKEVGH